MLDRDTAVVIRWTHGARTFWRRGGRHLQLTKCETVHVGDAIAWRRIRRYKRWYPGRRLLDWWSPTWAPTYRTPTADAGRAGS